MRTRSVLATSAAFAAAAAGLMIAGAAPVSADQAWHQSIGRASAQAACPSSSASDTTLGWSAWEPSWETWADEGQGGWTCTRSITWALSTPPPSGEQPPGCIQIRVSAAWYLDFGSGYFVPRDSEATTSCTPPASLAGITAWAYVYATDMTVAETRCKEGLADDLASVEPVVGLQNVYICGVV